MWTNIANRTNRVAMKRHMRASPFRPILWGLGAGPVKTLLGDQRIRRAGFRFRWSGCSSGKLTQANSP